MAPLSDDSAAQADRSGKDAAVTAVWADVQDRWELLAPTGFGDEATLHDLVEKTPDLLPLAGGPEQSSRPVDEDLLGGF